ncbi:hypothetical protein BZG36_01210 [Bifiguratus adelaidae]|uniref:SUI1 domain-containing protein n=1 Tax=Bifiguratus adelaidae TaxID=1938954 RepID=A0A261Y5V5_9FUNG|nr:hypothetical protein BZG36_01210 [Bifiguratus adelaidae]
MFKKPILNVKSFSSLRASDRRRLRQEITQAYPSLQQDETDEAPPVVPDDIQCAKFSTHGEDLGILYVAQGSPLWVKFDSPAHPVPTVYTLWQHPSMLPTIVCAQGVLSHAINGADLMIPGIIHREEGLPDLKAGELVAIQFGSYPLPLAVGVTAIPTSEMIRGQKGKAVHMMQVYQDYLWAMGPRGHPPDVSALPNIDIDSESDYGDDLSDEAEAEEINQVTEAIADTKINEPEPPQLSIEEIDSILENAFFHCLLFKITPKGQTELLPMPSSTLYSAYILPSRPRGVGSDVDVKKSSYKKMAKFLKNMEKRGIIKTKEQKGEIFLVSVDWKHKALADITEYKTVASQNASAAKTPAPRTQREPTIVKELYKPIGTGVHELFAQCQQSRSDLYTSKQVREMILQYIDSRQLVDQRDPRRVEVDPILCDAVLKKEEYQTINTLSREEVINKLLGNMQPWHQLVVEGEELTPVRGHMAPCHIIIESRQGRKTATRILGMERFNLDIGGFAEELKRLCASSVSVTPAIGSTPKHSIFEVMVQGPQAKHATELLIKHGVPKKYIELTDKTGKTKKK